MSDGGTGKRNAPKLRPWHPPHAEDADVYAIKALAGGDATGDQQRRALAWIIGTLCGKDDLSYRPDSPRDTDFAEGKRFVALELTKYVLMPVSVIRTASGKPPGEQG